MIRNIYILTIFIICPFAFTQERNEFELINLLNSYNETQLYIYNILDSENDNIYLGTNRGIYTFDGYRIEKYNNLIGYIEFTADQELVTSSREINQFNRTSDYNFLIEAENESNETELQAISKSNLLFVLYNGSLRVYRNKIFKRKLLGHSVRSITENYIGTYSGIFNRNEELKSEIKTDSYIREFKDALYICYSALALIEGDKTILFNNEKEETVLFGRNLGTSKDIVQIKDSFLLFTTKGVFKTDLVSNLETLIDTSAYTRELSRETFPKFISYNQDKGYNDYVYFYANNLIYQYYIESGDLSEIIAINDALYLEQDDLSIYFLDLDGLKVYTKREGIRTITNNNKNYHSFSLIGKSRFILASDTGLDIYDFSSGNKVTLITQEFNYGSIYKDQSTISIGTTNGYFYASIQELINLPLRSISTKESKSLYIIIIILALLLTTFITLTILIYKKRKKRIIIDLNTKKKEDIKRFILENLSTITVTSIQNEFNISYRQLSKLFSSPSLAKFIEIKRKEILKEGFNQAVSIEEISKRTGYSVSYLKRIKSTNKS